MIGTRLVTRTMKACDMPPISGKRRQFDFASSGAGNHGGAIEYELHLVLPGGQDINPAANAIQSLVATKATGQWRIALFQNTPAQFHGRPELAQQLSDELRQLLRER